MFQVSIPGDYEQTLNLWRQENDAELRADESWLTLTGLYWLTPGVNTLGSDDNSDIVLPAGSDHIGTLTLNEQGVSLRVLTDDPVYVDGELTRSALLRSDTDPNGASRVRLHNASFILIQRGEQYAVRVWDRNHPALEAFSGRQWFTINKDYYIQAEFIPHNPPRDYKVMNQVGMPVVFNNHGYAMFDLFGTTCRLEAFEVGEGLLWFLFKDATNGVSTYGAGRFLYAILEDDKRVVLDFNKAYNPPCAFTPYATCPIAPPENTLPLQIQAGERLINNL